MFPSDGSKGRIYLFAIKNYFDKNSFSLILKPCPATFWFLIFQKFTSFNLQNRADLNHHNLTTIRCLLKRAGFVLLFSPLLGLTIVADEAGGAGGGQVIVSGQFNHSKVQDVAVTGTPAGSEAAFHQEIFGKEFALSVSNLDRKSTR